MPLIESKHIPALLTAYQIPQASLLSELSENSIRAYWYPFGNLALETLIQDSINYAMHQSHSNGKRRVVFLISAEFSPGIAVLLNFSSWNKEQIISLKNASPETPGSIIKNLYSKVDAIILGDNHQQAQSIVHGLTCLLRKTYSNVDIRLRPMGEHNPDMVFTSYLHQWLTKGNFSSSPLDIKELYAQHHQTAQKALLTLLKQYRQNQLSVFQEIAAKLQIITKYQQLLQARHQLAGQLNQIRELAVLDGLQRKDRLLKASIYNQQYSLTQSVQPLFLDHLLTLLTCKDEKTLALQISAWQQSGYQQIKSCEEAFSKKQKELQQSWKEYAFHLGKRSVQALYSHSLIGLGAEVSGLLGKVGIDALKGTSLSCFRRYLPVVLQVSESQLRNGAKCLGGTLGLIFTGMSGWEGLLRLLLIQGSCMAMSTLIDAIKTDDKNACVWNRLPDSIATMRITSLLLACIESCLTTENQVLLTTLGAMSGNIAITKLGKKIISELQTDPHQPMTESQALIQVSLTLFGQKIGVSLTRSGYQVWDKLQTRAALEQHCEQQERCHATFSDSYLQWGFWANPTDKVRLSRIKNQHFLEADCEINKVNPQVRVVNCEIPKEYEFLPLSPL